MPLSKRVDVKEEGRSERLKGAKEKDEGQQEYARCHLH